jgi:hypothetical protein
VATTVKDRSPSGNVPDASLQLVLSYLLWAGVSPPLAHILADVARFPSTSHITGHATHPECRNMRSVQHRRSPPNAQRPALLHARAGRLRDLHCDQYTLVCQKHSEPFYQNSAGTE